MVKVGVLGAGFMGSTHAKALATSPDVEIVGICQGSREFVKRSQLIGASPDLLFGLLALGHIPVIDHNRFDGRLMQKIGQHTFHPAPGTVQVPKTKQCFMVRTGLPFNLLE